MLLWIYCIYVSFFRVQQKNLSPFGCTIDNVVSDFEDVYIEKISGIAIVATDFFILGLYIIKIVQLSCHIPKRQDSTNSIIIKTRLRFILCKLLVISLVMELFFVIINIGYGVNDTHIFMFIFNYICLCLDGIISMKGIFLMLQSNSQEFEKYARFFKCSCLIDEVSKTGVDTEEMNSDNECLKAIGSVVTDNISTNIEQLNYEHPSETSDLRISVTNM